jgi:uncharacterized protein (DUF342 family)
VVDFPTLQSALKERLDEDRSIRIIEAEGANVEDAVSQASTLLDVPIRQLEYEVVHQESSFFGVGRNLCKIRAYQISSFRRTEEFIELEDEIEEIEDVELIEDSDGEVYIQRRKTGIYIKVTPPEGEGHPATLKDAEQVLKRFDIEKYDVQVVAQALKERNGEYQRIGVFNHMIENDTMINVEIVDAEMKAYMTVTPPNENGADFSYEDYSSILKGNGVLQGVNEDFLRHIADKPVYRQRMCVANGAKPIDGMNAYLEYFFEVDASKTRIKESSDGRVDFKQLNLIQNVVKDDPLAKKVSADMGTDGYTVTGKVLPAKPGKDTAIQLGKNVRFANDGETILSDINGQVVLAKGKISVDLVHVVDGSVNLRTGNIIFVGNVEVTGDVEEGFSVKASGNIEVHGAVNKASLEAEGSITVKKGITGKEGTAVYAKQSVYARFIENSDVQAGDSVLVTDAVINSKICAGRLVKCGGKKAALIGGHIRAGELISAKVIGSHGGGTETICDVGYNPFSKMKLENAMLKKERLKTEHDDLQNNLQTLIKLKQQNKTLPEDKETFLQELTKKNNELTTQMAELDKEIHDRNMELKNMVISGRVVATSKVHQGVTVIIREQKFQVKREYPAITFLVNNNMINTVQTKEDDK